LEKQLTDDDPRRFSIAFEQDPRNILALNAVTESSEHERVCSSSIIREVEC
jgi:hypothetical protein